MPPEAIVMQMAMGGWVCRTMSEVSKLDVPDALLARGPQTAAELVAGGIAVNTGALERALRALASVGLFTEGADGRFGLTPVSEVLTSSHPHSVKIVAEEVSGTWLRSFGEIGASIRDGEPHCREVFGMDWWDYLNANPVHLERFGLAMKANSLNSLRGVLEKCDFTGVGLVADIAGGFGHLVIALLQKYPNLKGVLTDLPELIPVSKAKNPVSDPAVASRLEYVGANMFDGVPPANA
jgi:hypothetical protein